MDVVVSAGFCIHAGVSGVSRDGTGQDNEEEQYNVWGG